MPHPMLTRHVVMAQLGLDAYERFCHCGKADTAVFTFSQNRSSQPDPSPLHFPKGSASSCYSHVLSVPFPCPTQLPLSFLQMNLEACLSVVPWPWKPSSTRLHLASLPVQWVCFWIPLTEKPQLQE